MMKFFVEGFKCRFGIFLILTVFITIFFMTFFGFIINADWGGIENWEDLETQNLFYLTLFLGFLLCCVSWIWIRKYNSTYEGEVIDKWAREGKGASFYLKLSKDGKTFTREIGEQQYKHKKIEAGDYVKKAPNTFEIQVIPPSKLNLTQD